ncbi:MAG: glutaminase A [Lachnospiraceae bacterium]|nr:glutaminase A [Lachnospiraceae bacterium]
MKKLLNTLVETCRPYAEQGEVANYIPELAKRNPNHLSVCVVTGEDEVFYAGDYQNLYTMQSVIKPMLLLVALMDSGMERVRGLVGVEATGKPFDAFNYSDQALTVANINPMINAGAIALSTLIKGKTSEEKFQRLLEMTRKVAGNPNMEMDEMVYLSEKATGNKNRALAYMLKAYRMVDGDVEDMVDCYFRACSVKANCIDLAQIAYVFANHGANSKGEQLFPAEYARYVNATLITCGMYDGSGEFALNVGFPAKSGVGGGIMGVIPKKMGIGVFAPALDKKGNSLAGIKVLEALSQELELSIF